MSQTESIDERLNQTALGREMLFIDLAISVTAVLISLSILWWNAAPSVTFHDSGEFALAARCGGIPHAPGAPAWTMLATAFIWLGAFSDAARGTNLFCGLLGAISLGVLISVSTQWSRLAFPQTGANLSRVAGVASALVLFNSTAFLEQSLMTEQYTLLILLLILFFGVSGLLIQTSARNSRFAWWFLGFIWGVAVCNHLSQVILGAPALILLAAHARFSRKLPGKETALVLLGLFCGLLIFLWIPLRSRMDPILDWGNMETVEGLWWGISRKHWASRPLSQAPPHFLREWLLTYDFIGELGIAGFLLAIVGVFAMTRLRTSMGVILISVAVPYAAGMLIGHMKQQVMDVSYIRQYGVRDWHLPLYAIGALMAGPGLAMFLNLFRKPLRGGVAAVALIALSTSAFYSVTSNSLRHWLAPSIFIRDILNPIPQKSVLALNSDNISHMLIYSKWQNPDTGTRWVAYGMSEFSWLETLARSGKWNMQEKVRLVSEGLPSKDRQPLRIPSITAEQAAEWPLYIDGMHLPTGSRAFQYVRPVGFLFELVTTPTLDAEIRRADMKWREEFPEAWNRRPDAHTHRLEREARGLLHQNRGSFFFARQMWPEAAQEYAKMLEWLPDNGDAWLSYGYVLEQLGAPAAKVTNAYEEAVRNAPWKTEPLQNLAGIHVQEGRREEAVMLLQKALKLSPSDPELQHNLKLLREEKSR